jgi:hypothetical protein
MLFKHFVLMLVFYIFYIYNKSILSKKKEVNFRFKSNDRIGYVPTAILVSNIIVDMIFCKLFPCCHHFDIACYI